jgi:ketosteroid isomerase-like protein
VEISQENVEIVRRIYEAAERRDSATILTLYDRVVWFHNREDALEAAGLHE